MELGHFQWFSCILITDWISRNLPVRSVAGLQRVKNPPIPLKDFASIESMKEEINEVVAFLKNPRAFQEMGARAPRVG